MIEIKNLTKYFGSKKVLDDIHLSFEPGHVYGIVGENGAGKTTLFRCLAGLESYSGKIDSSFASIKDHLGYLETTPVFMSFITGWEYLKLLCVAKKIETDNFTEQNIFDLPLDQYAETYSTGMKKKLGLMGVLLRKNDILILDEPFNGVDIQSNMMITKIIEDLKKLNKIIIISSHIFSSLSEMSDEIILLSKGRVIKKVQKSEYAELESEMKKSILGSSYKNLELE